VTAGGPAGRPELPVVADDRAGGCCAPGCACAGCKQAPQHDAAWQRAARMARLLSWASLAWMCAEGAIGLWQGLSAGSAALTGWALGSAVEGMASVVVVWRFTGARMMSQAAERRARLLVAGSFWLLAPCIASESLRDLIGGHHAEETTAGIILTAVAVVVMPLLGRAKRRLGARLGSASATGEGTQNYLCAAQAATVLAGLAVTAAWPGGWWADPAIGLAIAAATAREGTKFWRGDDCC
jgi:divalent metal cation (Fe/Co/Zn/Cd) transporter